MCASFSSHHPLKFSYVEGISSVRYCFTFIYLVCDMCLCLCLCMLVPQCVQKRQRATWVSWLSLCTTWVLETSRPWWQTPLHSGSCWKFRACVMCVCVGAPACQGMSVDDRGQLQEAPGHWIQALRLGGKCLNCWSISRTSLWGFMVKPCSIGQKPSNLGLFAHLSGHLGHFQPDEAVGSLCVWPFPRTCAFFPLNKCYTDQQMNPVRVGCPCLS